MENIDYVKEAESHAVEAADIQLVGMKLGDEEYAVDVLKIQEIIRTVEITIVPRSDSFVLGVMNLRGKVIPVIDLRVRFNLDKTDFDKATRVIVVRFEKEQIGFVVDEVTQVIRIAKSMVEPTPPLVGAIGQEYILGICKFNERLIILLDIDRVVGEGDTESALRQRIVEKKDLKMSVKQRPVKSPLKPEELPKAPEIKSAGVPKTEKYSMADEVGKPQIISADAAANEVLKEVEAQSKTTTREEALIKQNELDGLLASAVKGSEEKQTEEAKPGLTTENALSIEELIAMELSKREAETEELNKRKREGKEKKK
ncbi:MAG: chemotaxis protein CheW [Deferribacteraceae bacterium]|jgi:chemotaxis signal transduction protein|nr:chemotaxis protein CheW [Deferribacteraceae bacterium]